MPPGIEEAGVAQIQRKSTGDAKSREDADAIAARGTSGPGGALPHGDTIQRAFGHHDVSGVQAHVGGDAAQASEDLGAKAFATGGKVAFASSPDLHTAAHETAHVVQQQRGVQTKGLDGGSSDPHEQHADAVADAVVAGKSAASLLDQMPGGSAPAVQRKFDYIKWGDTEIGVEQYIRENAKVLFLTVKEHLPNHPVAIPSGFASFTHGANAFLVEFVQQTMVPVNGDYDDWPKVARSLLRPDDLGELVDSGRIVMGTHDHPQTKTPIKTGPRRWYPQAARPVMDGILRRVKDSLARVVPRYLAARSAANVPEPAEGAPWPQPSPDAIVASHPCDWPIIQALCKGDLVTVDVPAYRKEHGITTAAPATADKKPVPAKSKKLAWDFVTDPKTPNMIVVTEPAGATAELVAAHFYGSTQYAYKVIGAPPHFAFPIADIVELRKQKGLDTPVVNPFVPNPTLADNTRDPAFGILRSNVSEQAALQQASADGLVPVTVDRGSVLRALERTLLGLTTCKQIATAFSLGGRLDEPLRYVQGKLDVLAKAPEAEISTWATQVEKQSEVVMRVGMGLDAIQRQLRAMGILDPSQMDKVPKVVRTPLDRCASAFVDAAVLSRLVVVAEQRVASAEQELELAPVNSLELLLESIRARIHATKNLDAKHNPSAEASDVWSDDPKKQPGNAPIVKYSPDGALAKELAIRDELTMIRALVLAKDPSAGPRIKDVYAKVEKLNAEAEVGTNAAALSFVMERYFGFVTGDGNHWVILAGKMPDAVQYFFDAQRFHGVFEIAWGIYVRGEPERALEHIKSQLGGDKKFHGFLQKAFDVADEIETRVMIAKIAVLVGITLLSMGVGAAVEGGALALGAGQVGAFIAASAAEAVTFTVLDAKILGSDDAAGTLIGNFAQNLATFGLLRAWRVRKAARIADDAMATARLESATRLEKATAYLLKGKELTGEGLIIVATSYAQMQIDSLRKTGKFLSLSDIRDLGKQGLAMALGIAIGGRLFRTHFEELRKLGFKVTDDMLAKVDSLKAMAKSVEKTKNPEQALELVRQDRVLLQDELALHGGDTAGKAPDAPAQALANNIKSLDAAELALALDEVVPGRTFMGSPQQLEPVVARLRENGAEVQVITGPNGRRYEVTDGKQHYTLHEAKHYGTTRSGAVVAKQPLAQIEPNSVVATVGSVEAGRNLLRRLAAGDRTALAELGYDRFPTTIRTNEVEWGLGRRWDGTLHVVLGSFGDIDWARLPHIRPLSHSHPLSDRAKLVGGDGTGEVSIGKFIDGDYDMAKLFPSAADISIMARAGIRDHHVHTPYVARGGDRVGNPRANETAPTVDFVIERATYEGRWASSENVGVYRARITARAGGKVIWRGDVWAADAGASFLYRTRPPLAKSKLGPPGGDIRTMSGRIDELQKLMGQVKFTGTHGVADVDVFARVLDQHRAAGSTVSEGFDRAGNPTATVKPADAALGPEFTMESRLGPDVEKILTDNGLKPSHLVNDYMAKRASDRAAALAELRGAKSQAELDVVLERTLGKKLVDDRNAAAGMAALEHKIRDAFGSKLSDPAVRELATVPGVDAMLPQLAAHPLATVEQIARTLGQVKGWPDNSRKGLVQLATDPGAIAQRLISKVTPNVDIEGMNAWVLLASRQRGTPAQLLDLEMSLDQAIRIKAFDRNLEVEVNYYAGKRMSQDDLRKARATPGFDNKKHENIDVESSTERWEMKRVDPVITGPNKFINQISAGTSKFTSIGIPNAKTGGSKRNIVDVDYGNRFQVPGWGELEIRTRVQDYISRNTSASNFVDRYVLHVEIGGKIVTISIDT